MALRDQPYIPLYIQDFLTDEKLMECSAAAVGVYIKTMCILHKQEEYGVILLKQKDKHHHEQVLNFAAKLVKFLPYDLSVVSAALTELIAEKVLVMEGDKLIQKRMLKDGLLSDKRSLAGKSGGERTQAKVKGIAKAKIEANTEYEDEIDNGLLKKIMDFFRFSEIANFDKMRITGSFLRCLSKNGHKDNFEQQFEAYCKIKAGNPKFTHSFKNFIGSQDQLFMDGAWNSDNWMEKLKMETKPAGRSKFVA